MNSSSFNDPIAFWNGSAGETWAQLQPDLDAGFAKLTDAFFSMIKPACGEIALDVGCGCGDTTLYLAQATGSTGIALGIDVSEVMLKVAERRGAELKSTARFQLADAARVTFTNLIFDLVISRFGVMFFADPLAAFSNIRCTMKSGARLAFLCWRTMEESAYATVPMRIAAPFLPSQASVDTDLPGPFSLSDQGKIMDILKKSGFHAIEIERFDTEIKIARDAEGAAKESMAVGPLSRAIKEVDEMARRNIYESLLAHYKTMDARHGIELGAACWLVKARA